MCSSAVAPTTGRTWSSRDYVSNGFRGRAEERVTLELGPRSELEIRAGLEKEVDAERWTGLDRSLRHIFDEGGGVADLRPGGSGEDAELRRLILGRAARLQQLGLAEQIGPAQWILKPDLEPACATSAFEATSSKRCTAR
jgi:type IV secretory pathway VirD2 relaxase